MPPGFAMLSSPPSDFDGCDARHRSHRLMRDTKSVFTISRQDGKQCDGSTMHVLLCLSPVVGVRFCRAGGCSSSVRIEGLRGFFVYLRCTRCTKYRCCDGLATEITTSGWLLWRDAPLSSAVDAERANHEIICQCATYFRFALSKMLLLLRASPAAWSNVFCFVFVVALLTFLQLHPSIGDKVPGTPEYYLKRRATIELAPFG